jgi:hypothetical protein
MSRKESLLLKYAEVLAQIGLCASMERNGANQSKLNPDVQALAACEETLRTKPNDVEALYNKGLVLSRLERD